MFEGCSTEKFEVSRGLDGYGYKERDYEDSKRYPSAIVLFNADQSAGAACRFFLMAAAPDSLDGRIISGMNSRQEELQLWYTLSQNLPKNTYFQSLKSGENFGHRKYKYPGRHMYMICAPQMSRQAETQDEEAQDRNPGKGGKRL